MLIYRARLYLSLRENPTVPSSFSLPCTVNLFILIYTIIQLSSSVCPPSSISDASLPSLALCQRWSQGPICPPLSLSCQTMLTTLINFLSYQFHCVCTYRPLTHCGKLTPVSRKLLVEKCQKFLFSCAQTFAVLQACFSAKHSYLSELYQPFHEVRATLHFIMLCMFSAPVEDRGLSVLLVSYT